MSDLRLVDLPMPVLVAIDEGDVTAAEALIGLSIPPEFASLKPIWKFMINLLTERPDSAGWTMHALVDGDKIVGNAGFKGAPNEHGEVELGFGIETAERRRGYAIGAARLLLDRAAREPSVTAVVVTVNPDNVGSLAVVAKAGFEPTGERMHERWGRQLLFRHDLADRVQD